MKIPTIKKPKFYTVAEATAITNFPGGSIKFFAWLRKKKILKINNLPYQKYRDKKWLEIRETKTRNPLNPTVHFQPVLTWNGIKYIGDKVQKEFYSQSCLPLEPCPECPPSPPVTPCIPCEEQNNLN